MIRNKLIISSLIIFFLITLVLPACADDKPIPADKPAIRFNKTMYGFGSVEKGEVIKYSFEFINEGSRVLKIEDLVTS